MGLGTIVRQKNVSVDKVVSNEIAFENSRGE